MQFLDYMVQDLVKIYNPIAIYTNKNATVYGDMDFIIITNTPKRKLISNFDIICGTMEEFSKHWLANFRKDWILLYGKDVWKDKKYNDALVTAYNLKKSKYFYIDEKNYKRVAYGIKTSIDHLNYKILNRQYKVNPLKIDKIDYRTITIDDVKKLYEQYKKLVEDINAYIKASSNYNSC